MSNTVDVIGGATERRSATAQPVTDNLARWLQAIFWSAAIGLGPLQSWVNRHAMQSDGISYLDMGDAYLRGDWPMAINGYWSPLYSWLLGVALRVIKPSPYWEFPVAHLVNFVMYLCALLCFAFFLREVIGWHRARADKLSGGGCEILAADGMSNDGTRAVLDRYAA